jgi:hypothetical protein
MVNQKLNVMKSMNQPDGASGSSKRNRRMRISIAIKLIILILLMPGGSMILAQTSQTPTQTVCAGSEPYLVTATPGSTYNWSVTPGSSGTDWSINGAGNSITVDWNSAGIYTLSVTETNSYGCNGTPVSVTVTVNPIPVINDPPDQNVSNGAPVNAIAFTGSVPGTVYRWTNDTPSIGLATLGSGNITSFTAINSGTVPVVATITVTPSYTNAGLECTGTSQTFTITVNPSTTIDPVANAVYCDGTGTQAITFSSPVSGTTFSWTNNNAGIGLASSGTGNIPSFAATNTGTVPIIATITVTPYINSVPGNPISFTITVNPLPATSPIFHN